MKPSATLVPLEEYLHASFEHECEYVDGVILERGMPLKPHSKMQRKLIAFFVSLEGTLKTWCFPEQRIQVRPTRVRVPDVCVYLGEEPGEDLFVTPPYLAVEILSPDDRHGKLMDKIRDFRDFGVQYIWVVDPVTGQAQIYTKSEIFDVEDGVLWTEGPRIEVRISNLMN